MNFFLWHTSLYKKIIVVLSVLFLGACTSQPTWLHKKRHYPEWEFSPRAVNEYSFSWEKEGDNRLFPEIIFSTQDEVWLRFYSMQAFPAIFSVNPHNQKEIALRYYRNPPYIILQGYHSKLKLKAGDTEALLWHRPH